MDIYAYALKLLAARDYTAARLVRKLEAEHGAVPQEIIDRLIQRNFLNDRRFAQNYVSRLKGRGLPRLREELAQHGVEASVADEVLAGMEWPSLQQALEDRMKVWKLRAPLQRRDAARLFRALSRLGYDEGAVREEVERLHEQ